MAGEESTGFPTACPGEEQTAARLARLRAWMFEDGLSAYIARGTTDIHWLTAFDGVFDEERAHLALVTAGGCWLHSDTRYSEMLRACSRMTEWTVDDTRQAHAAFAARILHDMSKRADTGWDDMSEGAHAVLRIGIEHDLPLDEYRSLTAELVEAGFEVEDASGPDSNETAPSSASAAEGVAVEVELVECVRAVFSLRAVKDASEIERHRHAQRITDRAFAQTLEMMKPGVTEKQVASILEFNMRDLGADGLAFPSIVASGPHASMPHALPSDRELCEGDFVVMDFGARAQGYCADMTRTVSMGKACAEKRAVYDATLRAHEQCKAAAGPGVVPADLHHLAEKIVADAGYEGRFTHSLGHGVGLDIHELPFVSPRTSEPLVPGNIITIEPGIYVPGVCGVRIEDFGLITNDGFEDFAESEHNLIEL